MERKPQENTISNLSSYSTIVFALALMLAVILDIVFPMRFLSEPSNRYIGVLVVILGTIVVFWAENVGRRYSNKRKAGEVTDVSHISKGVYSYTRNPKYVGLGILLIGLGIILNSLFVTFSAFVSILVIHFFLLHKEEELLESRHGNIYHEYKKKVKRWI